MGLTNSRKQITDFVFAHDKRCKRIKIPIRDFLKNPFPFLRPTSVSLMCSGLSAINKKRKSKSTKTVDDYLIKCSSTVHNPEFVEVTSDKIGNNILCPLCNHRSRVCITTKEQADSENSRLESSFNQKMTE